MANVRAPGTGIVSGHGCQGIHCSRCNGIALSGFPWFGCSGPVQESDQAWQATSCLEGLLHGLHGHADPTSLALCKALEGLQRSSLQSLILGLVDTDTESTSSMPLPILCRTAERCEQLEARHVTNSRHCNAKTCCRRHPSRELYYNNLEDHL